MTGYKTYTLRELGMFKHGDLFPLSGVNTYGAGVPFYKVHDLAVYDSKYLTQAENYVSYNTVKEQKFTIFPKGSIVFVTHGEAISSERKRILYYDACISNNVSVFIPNDTLVDPLFIFYIFQTLNMRELVTPSVIPFINIRNLALVKVNIPPLEVQQDISKKLDTVDKTILSLKEGIARFNSIKQGLHQRLLEGIYERQY